MGLLTRFILRNTRLLLSLLFCFKSLLPPPLDDDATSSRSLRERAWGEGAIFGSSLFHDVFDWTNFGLDLTFCIKLFYLPDSILYAIVLLIGTILGRIVTFRGTYILFQHGGLHWSPFWIAPCYVQTPAKYRNIFAQLYCLVFTEMSIFLLQDYPSLSTYAHWVVINKTPAPLENFDNYNIAFSAIMLCLLLLLFVIAIVTSLMRLTWLEWTRREKVVNSGKIVVFIALLAGLMYYICQELQGAIRFSFKGDKTLPDNKIMGITICDEVVSFQDRFDFCDEESFAIHVAIAWVAATYFAAYVFFRPATTETFMDYQDNFKMQDMRDTVRASTLDAFAATAGATSSTAKNLNGKSSSNNAGAAASWYPSSPTNSVAHHVHDDNKEEEEYEEEGYEDDAELGAGGAREISDAMTLKKSTKPAPKNTSLPLVPFPDVGITSSARKGRSTSRSTASTRKSGDANNSSTTMTQASSPPIPPPPPQTPARSSRPKTGAAASSRQGGGGGGGGDIQWRGSVSIRNSSTLYQQQDTDDDDAAALTQPPIPRSSRIVSSQRRNEQQQQQGLDTANNSADVSI